MYGFAHAYMYVRLSVYLYVICASVGMAPFQKIGRSQVCVTSGVQLSREGCLIMCGVPPPGCGGPMFFAGLRASAWQGNKDLTGRWALTKTWKSMCVLLVYDYV